MAKKKPVRMYRHEVGGEQLLNRRPFVLEVDAPVQDVIPIVSQGGSLLSVDYSQAADGVVSFSFSDKVTILRAVLYTVSG
jgi:hypothetical protein